MGDIKYILEDSSKVFKGKVSEVSGDENPRNLLGYLLGCFLTFLPLFVTVYVKVNVISNGYEITRLVQRIEHLRDIQSRAEAELMFMENPKYLYGIAKKMGFDYPTVDRIGISKDQR